MGLPIDLPESLHYENGIADRSSESFRLENGIANRSSDTPSLGKRDCRSILRNPFIRQGRGVWHTPHKYPQIEMNNERISGYLSSNE